MSIESMREVIPGGVNSPVRSFQSLGMDPIVVSKAKGDTIVTEEGRELIDYVGSWGPLIHGHCHPEIQKAIHESVDRGSTYGLSCPSEEKLARKVVEIMDSIDQIRFVSSGTEACMTAIRLARGFTGRDLIVKCSGCYHGHADFFLVQAGSSVAHLPESSSNGVLKSEVQHTISLPFNDQEAFEALFSDPEVSSRIAAVILEPIGGNMGVVPAEPSFLQFLREKTIENGSLLIFDEVMSGFRVGLTGAQGFYGIKPDLTTFGKIIGGGFPAAAVGGRKEIMQKLAPCGDVYQAGTLSGCPVAMEAGYASIRLLEKSGFYKILEEKVKRITEPVLDWIEKSGEPVCLQQAGSMFTIFFGVDKVSSYEDAKKMDGALFTEFFRYLLDRGILAPPSPYEAWFVSNAHTDEHLDQTTHAILSFFKEGSYAKHKRSFSEVTS